MTMQYFILCLTRRPAMIYLTLYCAAPRVSAYVRLFAISPFLPDGATIVMIARFDALPLSSALMPSARSELAPASARLALFC